jgi:hypothetical protein
MGERFAEAARQKESEGTLAWIDHNIVNPALNAGPLGIYNTVANLTHLPEYKLPVDPSKPYSAEWFTQSLSGGAGAVLPFMLASKGAGALMRSADGALAGTAFSETAAGRAASAALNSERFATVAGAAGYGALQKPEEGQTRFGNAMGMGLGFLAFDAGNSLTRGLSPVGKALTYPLVGFVGGGVMSEGSSLFSTGKLASTDQLLQSSVQGMALNSFMPLASEGLNRLAENRSGSRPPTEQPPAGDPAATPGRPPQTGDMPPGPAQAGDSPPIPPASRTPDIDHVARLSQDYSDWLSTHRVAYPDAADFVGLTPEEIVARGFYHPEATNLSMLEAFKENGHRPLPDAQQVRAEVEKMVRSMPLAGDTGQLHFGEWNMEFLTGDKAHYFSDTYKLIVPRHHLMWVEEANKEGLARVAADNGYNYVISRENSRGQAVGFLVHPRLKVLGTTTYEDVANVYNIPDERPALRVDLEDSATGKRFSAVVVHLKSMMGGPEKTAPVRTEQSRLLANDLGPKFSGLVAGDWNTFLERTHDLDPLKKAGFRILDPNSTQSTQSMGGRLDGFLAKNMDGKFSPIQVRPFFEDPLITRGLSDHGLLTMYWDPQAQTSRIAGLISGLPYSWRAAAPFGIDRH